MRDVTGTALARYENMYREAPDVLPAVVLALAEALDEHRAVIRALLEDVGGYVRRTQSRAQAPVLFVRLDAAEIVLEEGLP